MGSENRGVRYNTKFYIGAPYRYCEILWEFYGKAKCFLLYTTKNNIVF